MSEVLRAPEFTELPMPGGQASRRYLGGGHRALPAIGEWQIPDFPAHAHVFVASLVRRLEQQILSCILALRAHRRHGDGTRMARRFEKIPQFLDI